MYFDYSPYTKLPPLLVFLTVQSNKVAVSREVGENELIEEGVSLVKVNILSMGAEIVFLWVFKGISISRTLRIKHIKTKKDKTLSL